MIVIYHLSCIIFNCALILEPKSLDSFIVVAENFLVVLLAVVVVVLASC
jgi:hypothetical protein